MAFNFGPKQAVAETELPLKKKKKGPAKPPASMQGLQQAMTGDKAAGCA